MNRRTSIGICIGLLIVTLAAFYRVLGNDFVNYDDNVFVTTNQFIQGGLTRQSIAWAFKSTQWAQWQPLTWLSYMLDYRVWKLNPVGFHLTNLLLHLASTLVLFCALHRMTGSAGKSGMVAGLFAVHPLHVESVAWVAERKDVLCAFFWMLAMWAYVRYVSFRAEGSRMAHFAYASVLVLFALGLMAKPMVVTLPFLLLLLDWWPLGRLQEIDEKNAQAEASRKRIYKVGALVGEKVPLFALSAASSVLTYTVQRHGGALSALWELPLGVRLANSAVAYVGYIAKMFWPTRLALLYPHPEDRLPVWLVVGSAALVILLTAMAIRIRRRRPYFAVGWLWYVGTLVPVIGVVQVGGQAMADRYTYVPLIGLFVALVWGIADLFERNLGISVGGLKGSAKWQRCPSLVPVSCAFIAIIAFSICTWVQTGYWKNNKTVFSRAVECTSRNYMAHNNLGLVFASENKLDLAVRHYRRALEITPRFPLVHYNLGIAMARLGKVDEAIFHLRKAVQFDPNYVDAHNSLGDILLALGKPDEAVQHYQQVVKLDPGRFIARYRLANALFNLRRFDEAVPEYREVIRLRPDMVPARNNLAVSLYAIGRYKEAWDEVHALERFNAKPHREFLQALNSKMPEPK